MTDETTGRPLAETVPDGVLDHLARLRPRTGAFVVGITGSVSVGKSVFSKALKARLTGAAGSPRIALAATDGFLRSNAELEAQGLASEKGFPASYDTEALRAALAAIRLGPTRFPGYSHVTYDVAPDLARTLDRPDILIIEGLNLRLNALGQPRLIDALIYLDADEADLEAWFVARFMGLWAAAEHDPASFYVRFRSMTPEQADAFARMIWTGINLRNLREHIVHARAEADIVVRKGADHAVVAVEAR